MAVGPLEHAGRAGPTSEGGTCQRSLFSKYASWLPLLSQARKAFHAGEGTGRAGVVFLSLRQSDSPPVRALLPAIQPRTSFFIRYLIPGADLAGGCGSSARARRLVQKTGARPRIPAPTGGAPASLPPTTPSTPPCGQAHKAVTTCRDNADSTSMSLLVSILRCKTRWMLEFMFEHYPPEW